jgi:hypothetical protein
MRRILKNFIFMALFLSVGTNLPEIQFSMAQSSHVDPVLQEFKNKVPKSSLKQLLVYDSPIYLQCEERTTTYRTTEVALIPAQGDSADCPSALLKVIKGLEPEDFFFCNNIAPNCAENCECEAYIDEDCNNAVGGQTPPTRCIYRSALYPRLYDGMDFTRQKVPDRSSRDPLATVEQIKCGFFVEAKGGCKCVQKVITRTDRGKEPVTLDQQ